MNLCWLTILLLSFAWSTALHIYESPAPLWALLLLATALLCAFLSSLADLEPLSTAGSAGGLRRQNRPERYSALKSSLQYCGLVLLAQGAILPFYYIWAARHHGERLFAAGAASLLKLFGMPTVAEGHLLYIDSPLRTLVFASTWEKIGALWFILFFVGGLATLLLQKARLRHFAAFCGLTLGYALLRYSFLIMLYATYTMHSLFWQGTLSFLTLLPLALLLTRFLHKLPEPAVELRLRGASKRHTVITAALAFALVFAGVSFFGWHDAGRAKPGRVLVEEYHSDWEWTTDAYDEQWFGERSGYNYYCFFNYLQKFYETSRNMQPINAETLRDVDVFIMKTPTKPFEQAEIAQMVSFVEAGGGLYLIGDHTNVFGTGTNLNQIAGHFGLRFNYDCTYELVRGNLSEYDAPSLLAHPAVENLPHFLFATSNTLSATWLAEEVIVGYGLKNLQADYSQKNFFPADTNAATMEFGLFLQSAGLQYGKGRVLAFTDSTVFSNFWVFMPGKPQLLLNSVNWLNRENVLTGLTPREISALAIALLLFVNIIWATKNRKIFPLGCFVAAGLVALVLGCGLYQLNAKTNSRLPVPTQPMVDIRFEKEYSQFKLPDDLEGFLSNMDEQLNTFYVWTQRLNYFPGVDGTLLDALRNGELAILAKPSREISDPQKIMDEIHAGARLLVLDNTMNGAFSNSLLKLAGMEIVRADMASHSAYGGLENIPLTANAAAIAGGEALIKDASGNTICAVLQHGAGLLAVFADPDLFYSYEMGDVSANLTEKTKLLANLEFQLLRQLVENTP